MDTRRTRLPQGEPLFGRNTAERPWRGYARSLVSLTLLLSFLHSILLSAARPRRQSRPATNPWCDGRRRRNPSWTTRQTPTRNPLKTSPMRCLSKIPPTRKAIRVKPPNRTKTSWPTKPPCRTSIAFFPEAVGLRRTCTAGSFLLPPAWLLPTSRTGRLNGSRPTHPGLHPSVLAHWRPIPSKNHFRLWIFSY
jgi:hypothetical protein